MQLGILYSRMKGEKKPPTKQLVVWGGVLAGLGALSVGTWSYFVPTADMTTYWKPVLIGLGGSYFLKKPARSLWYAMFEEDGVTNAQFEIAPMKA